MKHLITIILTIISVSVLAQHGGNQIFKYNYQKKSHSLPQLHFRNDSTLELTVNALFNAKADAYIAVFSVMQSAEQLEDCHTLIEKRINGLVNGARSVGVETDMIFVDFVSQIPRFEFSLERKRLSRTYNEIPAGFDLQKNVHIAFSNTAIFDSLITIASRNEIYDLAKVDYIVNTPQQYYDSLRTLALQTVNRTIESYRSAGFTIKPVFKTASENSKCYYPENLYDKYSAYSSGSLWTSKNVKYEDKKTTAFYNRLPYDDYHIIVDPVVVEPAVQFSYQLTVRMVLERQ